MSDKEFIELDGEKFSIPNIALGKVIPFGVDRYIEMEERAKKAERKQKLYFIAGFV